MPEDKAENAASIIPFGLTVLSIATFLMGFAAIFQSRTAWRHILRWRFSLGASASFLLRCGRLPTVNRL
jgi:hypothetical protein